MGTSTLWSTIVVWNEAPASTATLIDLAACSLKRSSSHPPVLELVAGVDVLAYIPRLSTNACSEILLDISGIALPVHFLSIISTTEIMQDLHRRPRPIADDADFWSGPRVPHLA
ncbi:hypothetical protein C8R44DRAFT_864619 [Mycena epipterygia]|nr:hypothetical protein C8R44DRAFT_864619 [Mycena epipterygia]